METMRELFKNMWISTYGLAKTEFINYSLLMKIKKIRLCSLEHIHKKCDQNL